MKNLLLTLLLVSGMATVASAVQETYYVTGNKIYDPCGDQFIPRGINYPVLDDWDFPANMNNGSEQSSEIMKANPNIVRIAWYNDYGQGARPGFAISDLDSIISRFSRKGIVSVINIMDMTCSNDYNAFADRVATWWVKPEVVALLEKHKGMVMANIANEFGYVNWTGDAAAALITWKDNYKGMITAMRNAGINVPIMIDAPDCGTSLDRLLSVGAEFQTHDPSHNIICSAHAYWGLDDSAAVANKAQQIANAAFPVILGEIANFQTDQQPCQYNIQYTSLLRQCQQNGTGWLAWCWYKDHCPDRQMTTNGMFNQLSPYGQVIVNNPDFGLATKAIKTAYQINLGNCNPNSITETEGKVEDMLRWYAPQHQVQFLQNGSFVLTDMSGRIVIKKEVTANEIYTITDAPASGIYLLCFIKKGSAPVHTRLFL